jgi:formiminoglutamate deiminase
VPVKADVTTYHAELAWLGDQDEGGGPRVLPDVLIEVDGDRFGAVTPGTDPPPGSTRLPGLTLPGLANGHSHAFHRALRGRTQAGRGTFWTWRDTMYGVAGRLTPAGYRELATAVYTEMALAGITCVGEFHYVHHPPGDGRYDDENAMGRALVEAAADAGIRITLLDTCYLAGGIGVPLAPEQRRFSDGDAEGWAARAGALAAACADRPTVRVGAAVHSVRAVPRESLATVAGWADRHAAPLHVHLSEQRAENAACLAAYGLTPTRVLAEAGALGPRTTAVHGTHLSAEDIALLGAGGTAVCMCPTTERDLADGIGPARALADAGCPLTVGSDSHAVIDLFEEARAVELDERLRTEQRGHWTAAELLGAATAAGHASLGWPDAGRIAPGALADLVTVGLGGPRLGGAGPDDPATAEAAVVFAATSADVRQVVASGRRIVRDGVHHRLGDIGAAYRAALAGLLPKGHR